MMFGRSGSTLLIMVLLLLSGCYHNHENPTTKSVEQNLQQPASTENEGKWEHLQLIGAKWTYRQHHGWSQNGDSFDELLCSPRTYIPWSISMDETHVLDAKTENLKIHLKVWMGASGEPETTLPPSALVGLVVGLKSGETGFIEKASRDFPLWKAGGYGICLTTDHKIQIIDFQSGKLLKEKKYHFREDEPGYAGLIRGVLMVTISQENRGKHKISVDVDGTELSLTIPSSRLNGAIGLLSHPGSTEDDNVESVFSDYSVSKTD